MNPGRPTGEAAGPGLTAGEVLVASINGVFGVRGEVRLFLHDRQSRTLSEPRRVTIISPAGERRDVGISVRSGAGKRVIAKIEGIETPEDAHDYMDWSVVVPRSALPATAPGEYYVHDLLDLPVFEREAAESDPTLDTPLGKLEDVVAGERDVWVITGDDGAERFLVAGPGEVLEVDLAGGRLVIRRGAAERAE